MTTINQEFLSKLHELTTIAFNAGVHCPLLTQLYDWTMQHNAQTGAAITGNAGAGQASTTFRQAAMAALSSSPNGITTADLLPILAGWKQPGEDNATLKRRIGQILGQLSSSRAAHKTGNLWFAGAGQNVDSSIDKRRTKTRAREQAPAGNAEQEQQQAAAE